MPVYTYVVSCMIDYRLPVATREINRDAPRPVYLQLADILRDQITGDELRPESRLPSETELEERYGLTRRTIRKGIAVLRDEGYAETTPGKGTYVTKPEAWPKRE